MKDLKPGRSILRTVKIEVLVIMTLLFVYSNTYGQSGEQYIVTSQSLNVRSGEGTDFSILGKLSEGDLVTLVEKKDSGWWIVKLLDLEGYVFSEYLIIDPNRDWQRTNYTTGSVPSCENIVPKDDFDIDNYLRIVVGSGTDIVVKLMKIGNYGDECIRIVFIRSNDTYEMKNIPEGRYYLKLAYGQDYRQKVEGNRCYVRFVKNAQYEKGTEILDFNLVKLPNERIGDSLYESWDVPSFEFYFDVIETLKVAQSFKSKDISEDEFNK
jgi:uncharacterized protein YraI